MEKAKEILRLSLRMGLSQREVAGATGCSLGMVNAVLARVKESGVENPLSLDTKELGSIVYPPEKPDGKVKAEPDLEYINREMKRKGVTLYLLWEEYKQANPSGLMYTQFCSRYREYRKRNAVYLRKIYKAGERMLVDWAGLAMKYAENGKEQSAYVFVAVLPASSMLYAEPFRDMKMESWLEGHMRAFEYFGGVPRLLVPDNAKTAVAKAGHHEPELNATYREMAAHYGAAIVPARPVKPKDKAPVETGVLIVERRVIAKLRHTQFLTFAELREAFGRELEAVNDEPFQKLPGCRRSVFLETEKHELMRLPVRRYEYAQWKTAKVSFDYHVAVDKIHFYSVPYGFAGKEVRIRAASGTIEVFCDGERIACHIRCYDPKRRYITDENHMPEKHQAMLDWTPERFTSWAAKTGEKTMAYITALLESREHPEQAFRSCAGILRLASSVYPSLMEQACTQALQAGIYSYRYFEKLLERIKTDAASPVVHENLRGPDYYKGTSSEASRGGNHA